MDQNNADSYDRAAQKEMEGAKGLPVGVQVACLPYRDEMALRIMKEVETEICFDSAPAV